MSSAVLPWSPSSFVAPEDLSQIQTEFSQDWLRCTQEARQGVLQPPADRRFSHPEWASHPLYALMAHGYVLSAKALHRLVDVAHVDPSVRERLRFAVMQYIEAMSPANFLATNPEVLHLCKETQGASLQAGFSNLMSDLQKGRLTQTDESAFEVGRNLAVTPGAVVFQNPFFQLIQYKPVTPQVAERPLLIVPPCINKYYILDLQPQSSLVQYALDQGFQVFMVSWRNPLPSDADDMSQATWDDYIQEGVLRAIQAVQDISGQTQINTLGFCVGGTMLSTALAVAAARHQFPAASTTLLTTFLDFEDTGVLSVFVDELHARMREQQLGSGGLMTGRELATTFSFLRPGELVWNYVVDNYMKGGTPPAFDLLYWNADSTNLPGPFFTWYFRNMYLENRLKQPGALQVAGVPVNLSALKLPAYIYGSREDHIVPWKSAYASTRLLSGPCQFVLGASGHIAGVVNPPAKKKRHYWTVDSSQSTLPEQPDDWISQATQHPGSWWPHWSAWLVGHAGKTVPAPTHPGASGYPVIEAAPGSYVRTRAV